MKGIQIRLYVGPLVPILAAADIVDSLTAIQVTQAAAARSGFQLTLALGKRSRLAHTLLPAGFFDPGIRVVIELLLNGRSNVLMDGIITQQQVTPSETVGQSTLVLTGEDVSRAMDLVSISGLPYPATPPEARVALLIAKYALFGLIPVVLPSILVNVVSPAEKWESQKGTDLSYIQKLADRVGYVFYVEPGPRVGTNIAYWGPEIRVGAPQPALTIGSDAASNVESLSFTYDGTQKKLFLAKLHVAEAKTTITIPIPEINPLSPPLGVKLPPPAQIESLSDDEKTNGTSKQGPVRTILLGLARAAKAADVVTASGRLDVLRYGRVLAARRLVSVRGAGLTYDGLYFVKSVTHDIKRGEYKQSFTLSRNALVSNISSVQVAS